MRVSHRQPHREISLIIPGLLAPLAQTPAVPAMRALLRLLAHAQCRTSPARHYHELMLALFDVATDANADAPIAALARRGEGVPMVDGYWLRADPIHLYADQARLLLFASETLAVRSEEAQQLSAAISQWYAAAGWQLEALHPQRWYLRLPDRADIRTHALADAVGNDINTFLPYGKTQAHWHAVLNEIQMLLHGHPVNTEREAQGLARINSVWFWGGGELPAVSRPRFDRVVSAEPFAIGLARCAQIATASAPALSDALIDTSESLLAVLPVLSPALDAVRRCAALAALERDWFEPALAAFKANRVAALIIYPCDGHTYTVTRGRLRRFWQRRKSLRSYAHADDGNE